MPLLGGLSGGDTYADLRALDSGPGIRRAESVLGISPSPVSESADRTIVRTVGDVSSLYSAGFQSGDRSAS